MPRLIKLNGTNNTRDLGGYTNMDNKVIKNNIIFRSDKLSELTKDDIKTIQNLGIKTIIDFRSFKEKEQEPNIIPNNMMYIEMPINADKNIREDINNIVSGEFNKDIGKYLIEANEDFVNKHSHIFSGFLRIVLNSEEPLLFHCTAGKDRTGFAAYLILHILGVSDKLKLEDYLMTNICIKESLDKQIVHCSKLLKIDENKANMLRPLLIVSEDYINKALETINKKYGNIDNYIKNILNIDDSMITAFRKRMINYL